MLSTAGKEGRAGTATLSCWTRSWSWRFLGRFWWWFNYDISSNCCPDSRRWHLPNVTNVSCWLLLSALSSAPSSLLVVVAVAAWGRLCCPVHANCWVSMWHVACVARTNIVIYVRKAAARGCVITCHNASRCDSLAQWLSMTRGACLDFWSTLGVNWVAIRLKSPCQKPNRMIVSIIFAFILYYSTFPSHSFIHLSKYPEVVVCSF